MRKKWLVSIGGLALAIPMTVALSSFGRVRADEAQDVSVAIDAKNFPDEEFREIVSGFDQDGDKVLSAKEIKAVRRIEISESEIRDMTGVEYFTELTILTCTNSKISSIDVSKNTKLVEFMCSFNELKELDVSNNPDLEVFWCDNNELRTLDLSKNTNLLVLGCGGNKLTELDLSKNQEIRALHCGFNALKDLDFTYNPLISIIKCEGNQLTSLDVSFLKELTNLGADYNRLTKIKLGEQGHLDTLLLNGNDLNVVDIRQCPVLLEELDRYGVRNDESNGFFFSSIPIGLGGNGYNGKEWLDSDRLEDQIDPPIEFDSIMFFSIDYETNLLGFDIPELPDHPRPPIEEEDPTPTPTPTPTNTPTPTATPTPTVTPTPTNTPTPVPDQPTPTPEPGEEPSIADFVERLYTIALNRPSEPKGKQFWIDEITSGRRTGGDCGREFLFSEEFNNRGLSIEDFVETLYKTFFGRDSEPAGKAYWVGELKNGTKSRNDVINGFIDSTEWCNICATYGVRSGAPSSKSEIASKNAIGFATRLYTCCLGREPEEKGLQYWSLALTNLEQTGCSAASEFFTSAEFKGLKTSDEEYLKRLYTTFMDREPEASEVAYWAGEIAGGRQTRDSVLAFFGSSEEFTAICKRYGIERG